MIKLKDITDEQKMTLRLMGYEFDKETTWQWAKIYSTGKYTGTLAMYAHNEWLFPNHTPPKLRAYIETHIR